MEDFGGSGFEEFDVEIADYEVKKTKKFDRVWKVGEGGSICQVPLIHEDIVYFGACNRNIYAVDAETGKLVWKFRTQGRMVHSSPVFWKDRIFIGSFDHHMYALNAKTGKLIWKFRTEEEVASMPCVEDGKVFFGSRDQFIYCLEAETGDLLWKYKANEEIVAALTAHEGRLFVGSFDRNFYCLDTETGNLIWKFETQGEIQNLDVILVREGVVYITSFDNNLYAIDEETGRQVWKFPTGRYGNNASPTFYKGKLYISSRDGILYALTLDGKLLWKYTKNEMISIVEIKGDRIYIGSEDQNLYCLDMDGKELWKFATQGAIWLKPVVWKDKVIFPCWDCHMYAVGTKTHKLVWKFRTVGSPSYLPPPYESFEVEMKVSAHEVEEEKKKAYEFGFGDEEGGNTGAYKSRITYQVSTQYASKGKYQVDSQEEEF